MTVAAQAQQQEPVPQDLDAEESLLGALLLAGGGPLLDAVREHGLEARHFYRASHGVIYRAVERLHDQADPHDPVSVVAELRRRGEVDTEPDLAARVHELGQLAPATAPAPRWAALIVDVARRRRILDVTGELRRRGQTGEGTTDELLTSALEQLGGLADDTGRTTAPVVFESLRAFLKRPLPQSEALVGTARDGTNLLPRYGWVMPWGREGSGKTSVLVDLIFHAAAGITWLQYAIRRPMRFVVVINEGVPGGLQDKIQQKLELWDGDTDQVLDNIAIYVSPWGEFSFKSRQIARHARDYALDFQADYVALDPLHTLGTIGAGTPQETEEFKNILRHFGMWNDLGVITAHHSNKNGMVSGDWARHPDTVIRLEKDGKNPATKIVIEKARPADPLELGVPQLLEWITETMGYKRVAIDTIKASDADLLTAIHEQLAAADQALTMTRIRALVTGDDNRIGDLVKTEIEAGRIRNIATRRNTYLLTPGDRSTEATDTTPQAEQTRMNTDQTVCEPFSQTSTDSGAVPEAGVESVCGPSPLKGATDTDTDDGPHPDHDLDELFGAAARDEVDYDFGGEDE